jgi:hypothetical protein
MTIQTNAYVLSKTVILENNQDVLAIKTLNTLTKSYKMGVLERSSTKLELTP